MRTVLFLAAFTISAAPFANAGDDRFKSQWSEACQNAKPPFSLDFKSRSGDPTEDDMTVTLRWSSSSPLVLPVRPALYVKANFVGNSENLCRSVGAFRLPSGHILLLIPRDGRPSTDVLVGVVVNAARGSVVQVVGDVGSYSDGVMVISEPTGYRLLLLRDDAFIDLGGGGGEFSTPDWVVVRETQGHVSYKWETKRP